MNWGAIRPGLLTLVAGLTGIDDVDAIHWKGSAPAGGWRRGPRVTMSISNVRGVGRDDLRYTFVDALQNMELQVSGQRQFTWMLTFESMSPSDSDTALTYADRLRAKLSLPSSGVAMRALGVSVATVNDTKVIEFNSQAKPYMAAIVEIEMNAVENAIDDAEDSGQWIQRAIVSSNELINVDGEPVGAQIDDEITDDG